MATCSSCGGTLGRDCFNPEECALITREQAQEGENLHDAATQLLAERDQLRQQVEKLEEAARPLNAIARGHGPEANPHALVPVTALRRLLDACDLYPAEKSAAADQVRKELGE
jgi:hypothetical protein